MDSNFDYQNVYVVIRYDTVTRVSAPYCYFISRDAAKSCAYHMSKFSTHRYFVKSIRVFKSFSCLYDF